MSDTRLTLLLASLSTLSGMALYRFIGPAAGSVTVLMLIALFNTYRMRRARHRQELLAELRAQGSGTRAASLGAVSDPGLRARLRKDLAQEGAVEREGDVVRFPFPASFQRWATKRYWTNWLLSAGFLLLSALSPTLSTPWRFIWFVLGVGCAIRVWRASRMQSALATVLELAPFSVSELWPDGGRRTVGLGQYVVLATDSRGNLTLRNTVSGVMISISTHRLGFHDLIELLTERVVSSSGVVSI